MVYFTDFPIDSNVKIFCAIGKRLELNKSKTDSGEHELNITFGMKLEVIVTDSYTVWPPEGLAVPTSDLEH